MQNFGVKNLYKKDFQNWMNIILDHSHITWISVDSLNRIISVPKGHNFFF